MIVRWREKYSTNYEIHSEKQRARKKLLMVEKRVSGLHEER